MRNHNFARRFKNATSYTPIAYLQRVKNEAAKRKLETGKESIEAVMEGVGYSDNKTFRTLFKKITGLSPHEYRNKYNKKIVV